MTTTTIKPRRKNDSISAIETQITPHADSVLQQYDTGTTCKIIAAGIGSTESRINRWIVWHCDRDRITAHKTICHRRAQKAMIDQHTYTKRDDGGPVKLCGDCKAWTPDIPHGQWRDRPRVLNGPGLAGRMGRCGVRGAETERCDVCTER